MIEIIYKPDNDYTLKLFIWQDDKGYHIESSMRFASYSGSYKERLFFIDAETFQDTLNFLLDN